MSIAIESSVPEARNSCSGSFWRFLLQFWAQVDHCATVVYLSLAMIGQQLLPWIKSCILRWPVLPVFGG